MTEERIRDIIVENDVHLTDVIIKAMKQAVNESLDEATRIATRNMLPKTSKEIDNLKVK